MTRIDTSVVHPARRYDYLLGGTNNFEVDRESARQIEARMPTIRLTALENRWFLHRAVRHLAGLGIRQFLDVGSGIPTAPNTHQIAQEIDPTARIVYVDNDPLVLVHSRELLTGGTAYIEADLRTPRTILETPELGDVLDLTRPVALLLMAVLHFIRDDDEPRRLLTTLLDALPDGSVVVASHVTLEYKTPEEYASIRALGEYQSAARTGDEFAALFTHPRLRLLDPGVQSVSRWWPETAPHPRPAIEDVACNGLLARVG